MLFLTSFHCLHSFDWHIIEAKRDGNGMLRYFLTLTIVKKELFANGILSNEPKNLRRSENDLPAMTYANSTYLSPTSVLLPAHEPDARILRMLQMGTNVKKLVVQNAHQPRLGSLDTLPFISESLHAVFG